MNIIAYVLPAIIASYILVKLGSKESFLSCIASTSLFTILIFIINSSILIWGFDYSSKTIDFSTISMVFMVKYLLLSLVWALILPLLVWNIRKNIKFKVKAKIIVKENN